MDTQQKQETEGSVLKEAFNVLVTTERSKHIMNLMELEQIYLKDYYTIYSASSAFTPRETEMNGVKITLPLTTYYFAYVVEHNANT